MKKWRGLILLCAVFLFLGGLPAFINATSKGMFVFSVATDYLSGEESIAAEIESGIWLVNFRYEPEWDEKWQEVARVAFAVVPADLKGLITQKKPLKIGLKREIPGRTRGYYEAITNTISLDWGEFENLPWQDARKEFLGITLHEVGHAVDSHFIGGKPTGDYGAWLSKNAWENFLGRNPKIKENLKKIYDPKRDFYIEGFADSFQYYIVWGVFPQSPYFFFREDNKDLPMVFSWMKENVFLGQEPNREILREFLAKGGNK